MPRSLRSHSTSKTYHIILKGIDSQDIFYSNQDRKFFLKQLSITKIEYNYQIYAYCLMDNHVHMVIRVEDEILSKAMQSLSIRYAQHFNKKYKRTGSLFQDRFKSKKIEDKRYFLDVCRYVHRNPENAAISKTEDYEWSSYKEYLGKEKLVNKKVLLYYFNNKINEFKEYTIDKNVYDISKLAEYEIIEKLTDEQLTNIITRKFKINEGDITTFFKDMKKEELKKYVKEIKDIQGTNITQVARVIRIGRSRIEKMW